jgi:hypothetical protein
MSEQKFIKTYYSQPDKKHKVDVLIGRNYRNIGVNYDDQEVAMFNSSDDLLEAKEIITPDNAVIHLTYIASTMEFEVVLDGQQIDDSVTSPKKVLASLKTPYFAGIFWYLVVLIFSLRFSSLGSVSMNDIISNLFSADVFYFITSSFIVFASLIVGMIFLPRGSAVLYRTVFILVALDLGYGLFYQLIVFFFLPGGIKILFFIAVLFSVGFKAGILVVMIKNWSKFNRFSAIKKDPKARLSPDLLDQ